MICINKIEEITVLFRVFYGLKYKIDEDEVSRLIISPYFSDIFYKVLSEMVEQYEKNKLLDAINVDSWQLKQRPKELVQIKEYLSNINDWGDLTDEVKYEIIKTLVSPFFCDEETLVALKKEIDGES